MGVGQDGGVVKQPPPPTTDGPMGWGVAVLWAGLKWEGAWLMERGRGLRQSATGCGRRGVSMGGGVAKRGGVA